MLRRMSLLVAAALACALVLSACGSSDALEGKDAAGVLEETFGPDHPVRSGRLDVGLRFNATGLQGLDGPISARLTGPFQSEGGKTLPSLDLNLSLSAGGDSLSAGLVSTGKKGYLKLSDQVYDVGDDLYKQLNDAYRSASAETEKGDKGGTSFSALGIKPQNWLRNPTKAGEEEVGGTETVHVSAQVDVAKLLEDVDKLLGKAGNVAVPGTDEKVPTRLTAKQREAITNSIKKADFEVWSGKADGTLRRLRVDVAFDVPAGSREQAGGLQSGQIALELTISELNEEQEIKAPTGARPISELTSGLQQGAGGGTAPPPPAAGGGSGPQSKYLECLESAGQDLKKVQQCAGLLGQ